MISTHTIEHLPNYELVLSEIRRISKDSIIIVCPLEKKFKWGYNNHVNFFENKSEFLKRITDQNIINNKKIFIKEFLGDILYCEKKND